MLVGTATGREFNVEAEHCLAVQHRPDQVTVVIRDCCRNDKTTIDTMADGGLDIIGPEHQVAEAEAFGLDKFLIARGTRCILDQFDLDPVQLGEGKAPAPLRIRCSAMSDDLADGSRSVPVLEQPVVGPEKLTKHSCKTLDAFNRNAQLTEHAQR